MSRKATDARPDGGQRDLAPAHRPRAVGVLLFGGSAPVGLAGAPKAGRLSGEDYFGLSGGLLGTPVAWRGRAGGLFPDSVYRSSGF